jgi:hypothetical protein
MADRENMSVRKRRGPRAPESPGGVAANCEDDSTVTDDLVIRDSSCHNEDPSSLDVKSDNKLILNEAEICTVDALAAHRRPAPIRDDVSQSESASLSDDTPPSTPSTPGPVKQNFESRRRRRSLQDSRVSSSSSPARGLSILLGNWQANV